MRWHLATPGLVAALGVGCSSGADRAVTSAPETLQREAEVASSATAVVVDAGAPDDAAAPYTIGVDASPDASDYAWDLPPGFPVPNVPSDNPMSVAKVELGRRLFYDTRLSGNGTYSCASCHAQDLAFTDGRAQAVGSTGELTPRSAMSLANVAYALTLTWPDPLINSLEDQASLPMFNDGPVELGLDGQQAPLFARLQADPTYQQLFPQAFPGEADPFSVDSIEKALASFERTLISGHSPYDQYVYGDDATAMSEAALRGMAIFFNDGIVPCSDCHSGFNFTGNVTFVGQYLSSTEFHNTGLYNIGGNGAYPPNNFGLNSVTNVASDMGKFKAPTLRNLGYTAPYMHDGSAATLDDVIAHYAAGGRTITEGPYAGVGHDNPYKDGLVAEFSLTDQEKSDLKAFLLSLDDPEFVSDPRFSNPWQ